MSRRPKGYPFRERTKLQDVLADIKEYAGDETLPDRDILLPQAAGRVWHFAKELMNTPTAVESLLATIRVLRESSGSGKCSAEEELMNQLKRIGWECVGWLKESGLTPATSGTAGLQSSDPKLEPLCAVVMLLVDFARECFAYSRPRDNFGGKRRTLAFEILGMVVSILDLPDALGLSRQTIKKGRADALGAINFLEAYLGACKQRPDHDLEKALLAYSKRATRRGLAAGALNVLVKTGALDELEACDRIDEWKTEHWGGR
jgi:hypothetical protein